MHGVARMIVVRGSSEFSSEKDVSLTVGNFDGVHLGHRELLRRTVSRGRDAGAVAVALTFSPHPVRFFSPGARFYEITAEPEKADLIARTGIDVLVVESFDGDVGRMWPDEFARQILSRRLRARWVTVGYDFTFGRNRTGSPAMLLEVGRELGFEVDVVPPLVRGGLIVSSTRIRDLLLAGRVREAEELLCRPYRMSGPVVTGAGRGKNLGFPTANIRFSQDLVPLPGVYVVETEIRGRLHRAVASVGFNPTFGENSLGLEVHVMDFDRDIYGEEISVFFRDRIRDERKFKSVRDLVRQIGKDVQYAREAKLPVRREADVAKRDSAAASGSPA
ncbi:MAG: bifunctional riboflavin kinase/FAD synthetase [Deltaproteobacteria bacterium]|nr:MAG: bifunctional riboflavin kinase/FAD synthetase [Deltaproteobacteria bacterium]